MKTGYHRKLLAQETVHDDPKEPDEPVLIDHLGPTQTQSDTAWRKLSPQYVARTETPDSIDGTRTRNSQPELVRTLSGPCIPGLLGIMGRR